MAEPMVYDFPLIPVRSWSALVSDASNLDQVMGALAADPLEAEDLANAGELPPHRLEDFAAMGGSWLQKALETISVWLQRQLDPPGARSARRNWLAGSNFGVTWNTLCQYSTKLCTWCLYAVADEVSKSLAPEESPEAIKMIGEWFNTGFIDSDRAFMVMNRMRVDGMRSDLPKRYALFSVAGAMSNVLEQVSGRRDKIDPVGPFTSAALALTSAPADRPAMPVNEIIELLTAAAARACFYFPTHLASGRLQPQAGARALPFAIGALLGSSVAFAIGKR